MRPSIVAPAIVFSCIGITVFAAPPQQIIELENSVCRVTVVDFAGERSIGSGILFRSPVARDGRDFVLTAYHVLGEEALDISVTWDGEQNHPARVMAVRPSCDSVVLSVSAPPHIPRVPVATSDIQIGELCHTMGFGDTIENTLRTTSGAVRTFVENSYRDPVWFSVSDRSRQGDSGGPAIVIRNGTAQLVGNCWGGANDIVACRLTVIRRMFGMDAAAPRASTTVNGANPVYYQDLPLQTGGT